MASSDGKLKTFATLQEAPASLARHTNPSYTFIDEGGVYKIDSGIFDLNFSGTVDAREYDLQKLCARCAGINAKELASTEGYKHATTYEELVTYAATCFICASIKKMAGNVVHHLETGDGSGVVLRLVTPEPGGMLSGTTIAVIVGGQKISGIHSKFYINCYEGEYTDTR
jgi:hypothetical protein